MSSETGERGFALVLAGPSGAGKTTIARELVGRLPECVFSVSATTRAPRPSEQDGQDYDFVSRSDFERLVQMGELVEWATVHGNLYGTPKRSVEKAIEQGHVAVLDIDVQGAGQIRSKFPDAVLVFVLPPSAEALRERLSGRGTEARDELKRRLLTAAGELEEGAGFDYFVENDDLERAILWVKAIVEAERCRTERAGRLREKMRAMKAEIARIAKVGGAA